MGGILKNPLSEQEGPAAELESITEFRKQVYKNTQLNAQLTSRKSGQDSDVPVLTTPKKHGIPKDSLSLKQEHDVEDSDERLKWNQRNLAENEVTKQQFQDIHVDEPKTPYQGAVDPSGEYYREDDEEELDNFSLGEPEFKPSENKEENQGELLHNALDEEHDEEDDDKEARHRRFEQMRKEHYNIKEALKNRKLYEDDDEDEV